MHCVFKIVHVSVCVFCFFWGVWKNFVLCVCFCVWVNSMCVQAGPGPVRAAGAAAGGRTDGFFVFVLGGIVCKMCVCVHDVCVCVLF